MLRRSRRQRRKAKQPELDITAFLNLMVILVPFLLITAVFSRVTILDLYLPPQSSGEAQTKNRFQLEVIIANDSLTVRERGSRTNTVIAKKGDSYNFAGLTNELKKLKQRYPDRQDVSILSEPNIQYDTLVQVMDHVRMYEDADGGKNKLRDLFPNISIGDAPGRKS